MKINSAHSIAVLALLALATFNLQLSTAHAQGTAFTYQGRLDHGSNVLFTADLTFTLFTTNTGGSPVGGPITNSYVQASSNGLFTTTIDFGESPFTGTTPNWLEIGVRTNGVGAFTTLTPRQQLTPTPYAIYALNAGTAGNLSGTVPLSQLSGITSNQLNATTWQLATNLNGGRAAFASNVVSGINITNAYITNSIFAGNGSGLTNLNASQLSGTIANANLPGSPNFSGTVTASAITVTNLTVAANASTASNLTVNGNVQVMGLLRSGSETGTSDAPFPVGLVIRRVNSLSFAISNVVARTDAITLERDGTHEGLLIRYAAGSPKATITCLAQSYYGTNIIVHATLNGPPSAGTIQLLTSAQRAVHADISFGNAFYQLQMTHVVLDRWDDGTISDFNWIGTLTSTYNQ